MKLANLHDSRKLTLDSELVNFNSFMITWEGEDHFKKAYKNVYDGLFDEYGLLVTSFPSLTFYGDDEAAGKINKLLRGDYDILREVTTA